MSDISITITSDPTQAVTDINKVTKATDDLQKSAKKVSETASADASQTVNQVLSVSNAAKEAFDQTGTAVISVSAGIKQAAGEAAKVSSAFGQAVPAIGRLGSAIASAITGPVGAIAAAIGLVIAGIQKMIADAEERVQRLKMAAGAQTSSSYEDFMAGRQKYANQMKILDQLSELSNKAKTTSLSGQDFDFMRLLARQVGIKDHEIFDDGIDADVLARTRERITSSRAETAKNEYFDYIVAADKELRLNIENSGLSSDKKKTLQSMELFDKIDELEFYAKSGFGVNADDFKAIQELYKLAKPIKEARESFVRDPLLGRTQEQINNDAVQKITSSISERAAAEAAAAAESKRLADEEKARADAAEAEKKSAEKAIKQREDAGAEIINRLQKEIGYQELINDGKQREAEIERQRTALENTLGRKLTDAESQSIEQLVGTLYDLRHQQDDDLSYLDSDTMQAPRARVRNAQAATIPLDRLQRIGANMTNPAASPVKSTLDRSLSVQEQIRNILAASDLSHPNTSVMRF